MSKYDEEFKPERSARSVTRREFLELGLGVGGALLAGTVGQAAAAAAPAPKLEGELVFGCNGGGTQRIFEQQIIPDFAKRYGVKVTYVTGQPADHVAKLSAAKGNSGLDAVWLGGATTYVAADRGLIIEIDRSRVPNMQYLDPKLEFEKSVVPIAYSGNCMIYRSDIYSKRGWAPPTTWFDLWDPKLKGHTGMYSTSSTGGIEMILQVAKELTGDYKKLDPAFAKFKELRANVLDFFPTAGAWETAMQQGDLWLGVNSFTRAKEMTDAGMPIKFVFPKTGMPLHDLPVGIVKGAPHPNAAYAWIDYLGSKEVQEKIADKMGYMPASRQAVLSDTVKPFYPDRSLTWMPDWRYVGTQFETIVNRWSREVER